MLRALLSVASIAMFTIAGLSFLLGGRAISEIEGVDRLVAEVEGIGIAVVCGVLAYLLGKAAKAKD